MDVSDLLGFYSDATDLITQVSEEVSSFAATASDIINFNFSIPELSSAPAELSNYPDPLIDLSTLPRLSWDYPNIPLSPEDYKSAITDLRHVVDRLLDAFQNIVPDLGQLSLTSLPDVPVTDINLEYPSLTLDTKDIPSLPNVPSLNLPTIPSVEDVSTKTKTYSVEDITGYFESLADYIAQIRQLLQDQPIEVDTDFPNDAEIATAKKTLNDWLLHDYIPTLAKMDSIDLAGLVDVVEGTSIEGYRYYILPDGFVKAVMDFAENINGLDLPRKEPISYLDSLRMSEEIEQLLGETADRGFNEDVIDEGAAYDITLHRIKTQLELTEKKGKVLSSYTDQMWKAIDRKPKLYNQLSTWLLVSYYSLVDNIAKLYQVKIKTIQERIDLVDKAVKANQTRLRVLISSSLNLFINIETRIRNLTSKLKAQTLEAQSEVLATQAEALESQAIAKKIAEYVQKIKLAETAFKEVQTRLRLYEVKAGVLSSQLQFEILKNNQIILENQNEVLSTLTQFIDYDKLSEQYRLLANLQESKLSVFSDYVSYLTTVVEKLTQTPDVVKLRGELKNLKAQISKFLIQREGKDQMMSTWQSSLTDRWAVDSYEYKKLMQKIVYDAEASVVFSESLLADMIARNSGNFDVLGNFYSEKAAGALSAAHTVVSLTNKILEE